MNYYEKLGIDSLASKEEIENAYISLKEKYNPYIYVEKTKVKAKLKIEEITEAYEFLMKSENRIRYNEGIRANKQKVKYELEPLICMEKLNELNILENNIRQYKNYANKIEEKFASESDAKNI